jgi:hypothetical protein
VALSNVVVDGISAPDFISKFKVTTPTYSQFTLGPDPVNFAQFLTGPAVTIQNNVSTDAPLTPALLQSFRQSAAS